MTQTMLLFSLGPVQSFIAQARKARDLWLGSFLLSALMQESMENMARQLIFPTNPHIEGNIPDLPNKYIAIFESTEEAVAAATASENRIKTLWLKICNDVWENIFEKPGQANEDTHKQWNKQVDPANMFEFFWMAVEQNEGEKYSKWLARTQYLFDRRKQLRDFRQQVEMGEKSTISGERAALRGAGAERRDVRDFWSKVIKEKKLKPRDISQDGTERLDAIDTVKRFAHTSAKLAAAVHQELDTFKVGFPSVSSIATASYMEQLIYASEREAVASALRPWFKYSKALNEKMPPTIPFLTTLADRYKHGPQKRILEQDGDCFFPETFSERRLKKEFGFDDSRANERAQLADDAPKAITKLLQATDAITPTITRPTPYYAMIQMDGDRMGRLINGVTDQKEHTAISQALSTFSRKKVTNLVEIRYPGKLIYAGGDDVFALAPLARDTVKDDAEPIRTVLNLVEQLQRQYQETVRAEVIDDPAKPEDSRKERVTMSAGIAIAHHYTSLSYVRRLSKDAEKRAKDHYGRNALVVTVLRRSGEQTRVGCQWRYPKLQEEGQPIALFSFFYKLFVDDVLSPSCIHTLLEEVPALVGLSREAQESEIKRVLKRQRNPAYKDRFSYEEIKLKAKQLVELAEAMDQAMDKQAASDEKKKTTLATELHAEDRRYGLVEVLGWLLVMLFLARKEQE